MYYYNNIYIENLQLILYINNFPPLLQNQRHPDEFKVVLTGPKGLRVFEFDIHTGTTPQKGSVYVGLHPNSINVVKV